jgi:hypothetical protein
MVTELNLFFQCDHFVYPGEEVVHNFGHYVAEPEQSLRTQLAKFGKDRAAEFKPKVERALQKIGETYEEFIATVAKAMTPLHEVGVYMMCCMLHMHVTIILRNTYWRTFVGMHPTQSTRVFIALPNKLFAVVKPVSHHSFMTPMRGSGTHQRMCDSPRVKTFVRMNSPDGHRRSRDDQDQEPASLRTTRSSAKACREKDDKKKVPKKPKPSATVSKPGNGTDKSKPKPKASATSSTKGSLNIQTKVLRRRSKRVIQLKCKYCDCVCQGHAKLTEHLRKKHPEVFFQCDICHRICQTSHGLACHKKIHFVRSGNAPDANDLRPNEEVVGELIVEPEASTSSGGGRFARACKKRVDYSKSVQISSESDSEDLTSVPPTKKQKASNLLGNVGPSTRSMTKGKGKGPSIPKKVSKGVVRSFACTICAMNFPYASLLKQHMRSHSDKRSYVCPNKNCKKPFKNKGQYNYHVASHGNPTIKCEKCPKMVHSIGELHRHLETHKPADYYKCGNCGYGTRHRRLMLVHEGQTGHKRIP